MKLGDPIKILWHDGVGVSLYAKGLGRGRFQWPTASGGAVSIGAAQLGYLLEGIYWRNGKKDPRGFSQPVLQPGYTFNLPPDCPNRRDQLSQRVPKL